MADVAAYCLTEEEKQRLLDPSIGGVILFRRNFQNVGQLKALVQEIKALRTPELIIAVDHEGGRVQRFIEGFTRLPAMNTLGQIWDTEGEAAAKEKAEQVGWVLATELTACGIDLSFTPVLDLDWGTCPVIGNRSFHRNADTVTQLALALQKGLNRGGMKSCGKHFPGHGFVEGDSHLVQPEDTRSLAELEAADMIPFRALSGAGMAAGMPPHGGPYAPGAQPGYDPQGAYGPQPGYNAPPGYSAPPGYGPVPAYGPPGYPSKSKVAAGILALFLGTFGIHNFYLGYTGKALFQLLGTLLSCGFLALPIAIWAFIEGILILVARPGEAPWGVDASGMPLSG